VNDPDRANNSAAVTTPIKIETRIWNELGRPYEAALADPDEEAPMRQALEELQRLEARPAAAIIARRLQERGVRNVARGPRPSTRRNEAQLTARELDVLRLVAEGLRNAVLAGTRTHNLLHGKD
jgi:ATP/maltotriose-dependent transcriptional regulator MalT